MCTHLHVGFAVSDAADKYHAQLESGHTKLCPWSNNPSPASFAQLQLSADAIAFGLRSRLQSVQSSSMLPVLDGAFLSRLVFCDVFCFIRWCFC